MALCDVANDISIIPLIEQLNVYLDRDNKGENTMDIIIVYLGRDNRGENIIDIIRIQ